MPMFRKCIKFKGIKCGYDDRAGEVCFLGRWYPLGSQSLEAATQTPEARQAIEYERLHGMDDFLAQGSIYAKEVA